MPEELSIFDFIDGGEQFKPKKSDDWKWTFADYPKQKNGLKVFSCFACGGGSTMGYKLAGCDVIGDLEIDPRMNEIYVANHHPEYNYCMDIRDFNNIPNKDIPCDLFDIDILDGSPPCTTFSISGDREESWGKKKKFKEGQAEQTLDDLSFIFIQTVEKLHPKVVIMENVEGITLGNAWKYVQQIYRRFNDIGYAVKHWLLKGETMGVPQKRHRVFFIAIRSDLKKDVNEIDMTFNFLPVTYAEIKDGKGRIPTAYKIGILNEAKDTEHDCTGAWNRLYNNGGSKRMCFNHILIRNSDVFPTILAGHDSLFDHENKRHVSSNDLIHAQTFPEDFNFIKHSFSNINYVCGMSVPPIMIKRVVLRLIEQQVFDYKLKEYSNEGT